MTEQVLRKGSTCRGCGVYIEWILTPAGKNMPVDPAEITLVTAEGKIVKGFMPHWATCPQAQDFKRDKKK
jgi:hypothetical protein